MTTEELEAQITQLRAQPLTLLCCTKSGKVAEMSVRACVEIGSMYIHVVADDLDQLLDNAINGTDAARPQEGKDYANQRI